MSGVKPSLGRSGALLVATVASVAIAGSVGASIGDLVAFLERAERMVEVTGAARAHVTWTDDAGTAQQALLVLDAADGGRQFFSVKSTGYRSLTQLRWSGKGYAIDSAGADTRTTAVDDRLGGTDLRGIDFFPFWKTDYASSFISDQTRAEKTVSLYADEGRPYTLYVITFDKARMVPHMIKYYRDTFSNLVRIRTDSGHVMVGARPRPTKIEVRDFDESTTHTYELSWEALDAAPAGLVESTAFGAAPISWPAN